MKILSFILFVLILAGCNGDLIGDSRDNYVGFYNGQRVLTGTVYGQTTRLETTLTTHVGKMQDKDYIIIDAIYTARIKGNAFTFDKKVLESSPNESSEVTGGGGTFSKNEINFTMELTNKISDGATIVTVKAIYTFTGRK